MAESICYLNLRDSSTPDLGVPDSHREEASESTNIRGDPQQDGKGRAELNCEITAASPFFMDSSG
jgi:hypothetical protein